MKFSKLLVSLLTVFSVMFFVGCSNNDGKKDNDNPFLGTWIHQNHIDNYDNTGAGATEKGTWIFESNGKGTGTTEILYDDDIYEDKIDTYEFTYEVNGNKATMEVQFGDETSTMTITIDNLKEWGYVKQ